MVERIEIDETYLEKASIRTLEKIINQDEETTLIIIEKYPDLIMQVKNPTQAVTYLALDKKPENLRYLHKQTRDEILFAVKRQGSALQWAQFQDAEIAQEAVLNDRQSIRYINDRSETLALLMINKYGGDCLSYFRGTDGCTELVKKSAIISDPKALMFLSASEQTEKLCKFAIIKPEAIEWVCNPTKDMYLECVKKNGELLKHVRLDIKPSDYLEIALAAVLEKSDALRYAKIQNEEIILKSVSQNAYNLIYANFVNEKIAMAAVEQNCHILDSINNPSEAVVIHAVSQHGDLLRSVIEQTPAIVMAAINADGKAIQYVLNQTEDLCLQAVKNDPYSLQFCRIKTPMVALAAIEQKSHLVELIANHPDFDEDFFKDVLSKHGLALRELVTIKTPEMELIAVRNNWRALQYVDHFTEEICFEAYNQDPRAIFFMCPTLIGDASDIKIEDEISAYNSFVFNDNSQSVHQILSYDTMRRLECQLRDECLAHGSDENRPVSRKRMDLF